MSTACYRILGDDFERAGSATSTLKELFKRLGAEPQAMRRAVIAAYEAEMNVVIHARGGEMLVRFRGDRVDIEVSDEGPGIPDIELAMGEGYSTAPAAARELGFGAGMGLPNIKRNTDVLDIESAIGRGTRVRFSVNMPASRRAGWGRNSIRTISELCTECLQCLHACPTEALRVYHGGPEVLGHLCTDCTCCIGVCPSGAITMDPLDAVPARVSGTAIVPSAYVVQFGSRATVAALLAAFHELGFDRVLLSAPAERALREAVVAWGRTNAAPRPVISPACPAVVDLVQVRFPSLIPQLAPFLSPLEAAVAQWEGGQGVLVPVCPAQCTCLTAPGAGAPVALTSPEAMRQALAPLVRAKGPDSPGDVPGVGAAGAPQADVLRVHGMRQVMDLLDRVENGFCRDLTVVEPYACEQGCFGSPLLWENAFVARRRWHEVAHRFEGDASAVRRKTPLQARDGVRLDADMSEAIAKLARIEKLARSLPGKNCNVCGAPSCSAFAEDVVLGRVARGGCPDFVDAREDDR